MPRRGQVESHLLRTTSANLANSLCYLYMAPGGVYRSPVGLRVDLGDSYLAVERIEGRTVKLKVVTLLLDMGNT